MLYLIIKRVTTNPTKGDEMKTYTKTAELKKGVSVTLAATVYRETISLDGTAVDGETKLLKEATITVDGKDIKCGHDYGYALTQDAKERSSYRPECVAVLGDVQLTEKTWMIVQSLERMLYIDMESDTDYQEYAKGADEERDQDWILVSYDYTHDNFIASQLRTIPGKQVKTIQGKQVKTLPGKQVKTIPGTQVKTLHQGTYNGRRLTESNKIHRREK